MVKKISVGTVHNLPLDLRKILISDSRVLEKWEDITPLARNEWICWTITNKKPATGKNHSEKVVSELKKGRRRPCCWAGCIHRFKKRG